MAAVVLGRTEQGSASLNFASNFVDLRYRIKVDMRYIHRGSSSSDSDSLLEESGQMRVRGTGWCVEGNFLVRYLWAIMDLWGVVKAPWISYALVPIDKHIFSIQGGLIFRYRIFHIGSPVSLVDEVLDHQSSDSGFDVHDGREQLHYTNSFNGDSYIYIVLIIHFN